MSDETVRLSALMALSQAGDAKAYRELLQLLQVRLTAYFARRLAADAASVDDLVQETLMAIHVKRATYDPARPFTAWLFGVARYKLIDHYRRFKLRRTEPLDEARFAEDMSDPVAASMARMDLDEILSRLPPKQAEAIRLVRLRGLTSGEAAHATGATESAIKVNVHRGLKAATLTVTPKEGTGHE